MTAAQQFIPLNKLELSPTNARPHANGIDGLAHNILREGLLQSLCVVPGHKKGHFLVEAGGRRLAALQQLATAKHITKQHPVPCLVFDTPSLARSIAENEIREPMDPVDQFQSFGRLVGEGVPVADIADAFSVTPQFVRQRAKLAELVPEVIDAYRKGRIRIDQMQALTFGTPEQQRAIVAGTERVPGPGELRERLRGRGANHDDRRVKLVGLQVYRDAGGLTTEDLFASEIWLSDIELLDRLVEERLQVEAAREVEDGAAFAVVLESVYGVDVHKLYAEPRFEYAPTEAQAAEIDALEARFDPLGEQISALERGAEPEDGSDPAEALEKLEREMADLDQLVDDKREKASRAPAGIGVLIAVGHHGAIEKRRVVRKSEDEKPTERRATHAPLPGGKEPSGRAELSVKLFEEIAQHRQGGLALKVASNPQAALALVAQALDFSTFGGLEIREGATGWERPQPWVGTFERCPTERPEELAEALRVMIQTPASIRRQPLRHDGNTRGAIPLSWYLVRRKDELLQIISHCVAASLCDPDSGEGYKVNVAAAARSTLADLCEHTAFNLADVWKPTPAWLKSYGKAKVLEALRAVGADETADRLAKAKTAELVEAAAPVLAEAHWVPAYGKTEALRGAAA